MASTLHLDADRPGDLKHAARILQAGGLVAFPTETVYGLGANALSPAAVRRIFAAKDRPPWDPLIVHLAEARQIAELTEIPKAVAGRVETLSAAFWPGPLTLLLPRLPVCPGRGDGREVFGGYSCACPSCGAGAAARCWRAGSGS